MKAFVVILAVALTTSMLLYGPATRADATDPDDPQALARVWQNTLVVFPQAPNLTVYRVGSNLDAALRRYRPTNLPAVIFLHGCSGLYPTSTQVTRMIRALAEAGFVVFAPSTLDRPRKPFCDPAALKLSDDYITAIPQRFAELRHTLAEVRKLDWLDQDNLVLGGHSLGGWTVSQWSGTEFRSAFIFGATCQPTKSMQQRPGVALPPQTAVISVLGDKDEWFPYDVTQLNCGLFSEMRGKPNRKSIVLAGISHDVSQDPAAMPALVDFLHQHATRPIESIAIPSTLTARYDGNWSGRMECAGERPFTNIVSLTIAQGRFSWHIQVPAGRRGFSGTISDAGDFSAAGYIGKQGLLESVQAGAETRDVQWAILFGGPIEGDDIDVHGSWGAAPCRMGLRRSG